jgi:hypothetical protein
MGRVLKARAREQKGPKILTGPMEGHDERKRFANFWFAVPPEPAPIPETSDARVREARSAAELTSKFAPELALYRSVACEDWATYQRYVAPSARDDVQRRTWAQAERGTPSNAQAYQVAASANLTQTAVNQALASVRESGAGVCSTLAASAAGLLSGGVRGNKDYVRIEVRANNGHTFVVAGRELAGRFVLTPETWGNGAVIVDPWLASLGWDNGVFTVDKYPFPELLAELGQVYDNHAPDPGPETNGRLSFL